MIIKAIVATTIAMFIRIGYFLYFKTKAQLSVGEILIISQHRSELTKHYETIRNLKLGRVERKLSADTPITPAPMTQSFGNSFSHETRLLPNSRRPNKLKQMLWNLEVLEEYKKFKEQILSTSNNRPEIHLFYKDIIHTQEWDKHIQFSRALSATSTVVQNILNIYKILDSTIYNNVDLEMTMISLIKSARKQPSIDSSQETEPDTNNGPNRDFVNADQTQKKLVNDRLEAQVQTELKDQVEAEILMLITVLHNDLNQIYEATTFTQRLRISHSLTMLIVKLNWISKPESAKRLRTRITPLIRSLIFGTGTA